MRKLTVILTMCISLVLISVISGCVTTKSTTVKPSIPILNIITQITPNIYTSINTAYSRDYYIKYPANISPYQILKLRNDLYLIEGVREVYPVPYCYTILISKVYSWDEIEGKVIEVLKAFRKCVESGECLKVVEEPVDKSEEL